MIDQAMTKLRCDDRPATSGSVLVAIRHPKMRLWTLELLRQHASSWRVEEPGSGEMLVDAIARLTPDLLIVDDGDFPACCRAAVDAFPASRVIVIGTELDDAYRAAAFRAGAGAWIAPERVAEEVTIALATVSASANGWQATPGHNLP